MVSQGLVDNVKAFGAGGFGGVLAVLTGHPFDLTKVLLQTHQYTSTVGAIKGTLKTNGPLGFYKGVSSPLLGVTPMFAVSFWGYDVGKKIAYNLSNKDIHKDKLTIGEVSFAGFLSAIPTTLIAAPFERIKIVMQTSKTKTTFMQTFKQLYKTGGIGSVYKGSVLTLARDGPGSAAYFATYEYLKLKLMKNDPSGSASLTSIMVAGGCAGISMWVVIYPIDTIKSVQQSSDVKMSIKNVISKIYAKNGIKSFFPGIGPALARSFPANAATFLGVEVARNFLDTLF